MFCKLVKTVKKGKTKEGKDISFSNYYLEFDNGKKCYIMARYIPTLNVKDEEKKNQIESNNRANAQRLDDFADLIKKDE